MIYPVMSQLLRESATLREALTNPQFHFPKKTFLFLPCAAMIPRGKAPAPGRLVFPQICCPSRKPKINMRKTTRINLAACAEKLGVSVIVLSHTSSSKKKEKRKIAERQRVGDEGNKHRNGESWEQMELDDK